MTIKTSFLLAREDEGVLLQVIRMDCRSTRDVGSMAVVPLTTTLDMQRSLRLMAQAPIEEIAAFLETPTKELIPLKDVRDLRNWRAMRVLAWVGPAPCAVCQEAEELSVSPDFHCCARDKIVEPRPTSLVGPIQRPVPTA